MWPPPSVEARRSCTASRCAGMPRSWACNETRTKKARTMSPSLLSRRLPLASPTVQYQILDRVPLACEFEEAVARAGQWPLKSRRIEIFQINVGKFCNQTCRHCHVDAGPDRREVMSRETMMLCLAALEKTAIPTVDITGGAPELNPDFRWLVAECRARGRHVIDRCNLTVLELASDRKSVV